MSFSAETIFHFTPKLETLLAILQEGIAPSYCYEELPLVDKEETLQVRAPMISFSNVPLSEVSYQMESYGNFGIGLTLDWARKNALSPVQYIHGYSKVYRSLVNVFTSHHKKWEEEGKDDDEERYTALMINALRNLKRYEGPLYRKGAVVKERYRFYDEREWRYLPFEKLANNPHPIWIVSTRFTEFESTYADKPHLPTLALKIEPSDIKYVILESDENIHHFIEVVKGNRGMTANEVESLIPKIVTMKQIREDF